ncbi:phosphoglycerate dehydrogenase [Terrilactibacillus sp. BCM23-1]|uniref:Phosphoglycerate dehydrogenase n=1 Tax=Terrilactibacillus tamarindi TaxID=2599694 RepID=A0A6N8CQC2_9BACI|nr:phosphoglycerate dehydrogenase [Terrilactibacillus tamarindi]MTT32334.1 phosphoglycerate dehydrogenase [Terrilactibacillus tamarindi]
MSTSKKVLVTATNYSVLCKEAKEKLRQHGLEVIENPYGRPMTDQELKLYVPDVDAVIAGVDTWDDNIFQIAPKLRVISRFGVGIDNINLDQARLRGITVTNAPRLNANGVAELTIGLIFSALRNIPNLNESTKKGYWERFVGNEISGKTIGLLGFGNIPQMVAKKMQGFDVNLCAYDKYPNFEKAKEYHVQMLSLDETLRSSDIICMHLPSIKETYHIMNKENFKKMKDKAYFINTARGALVDEQALYWALNSEKLSFAAIDVFEDEPVAKDNPLFSLPNIVTTPHTAAETYQIYHDVGLLTADAVIDVLEGKIPLNIVKE